MGETSNYAVPWKNFAARWKKYYTPPGAPSADAIKIFKQFTQSGLGNKRGRVLLLGATPEIREMLYDINAEITLADINLEMILAMTELVEHKRDDEILIRGNWLNLPVKDSYFNVVIGDLALGNVPRDQQPKLLNEIHRFLIPGGLFVTRIAAIPDDWKFTSVDETLQKYEPFPYYRTEAMEMLCYLLSAIWDEKKEIVDTAKLKKEFEKYWSEDRYVYPRSKTMERALNDIWEMWKPLDKVWSYGWLSEELRRLEKNFTIVHSHVLNDSKVHALDYAYPIEICQKK